MAVEDDVVQDPAHVVFIISINSYNTKPTVILHFSSPGVFWLWPTVLIIDPGEAGPPWSLQIFKKKKKNRLAGQNHRPW
jgi:hypothetical protein